MRSIFSLQVSIPTIVAFIVGGAMMYGIFGRITMWSWAWWAAAFIFLLGLTLYRLPRIDIDIYRCSIALGSTSEELDLVVEGFINSRHPTALVNLYLCVLGYNIGSVHDISSIPNRIDSIGQTFTAVFYVRVEELAEGRIGQEKDKVKDIGKIRADTRSGHWFSEPFILRGGTKLPKKESRFSNVKKKLIPATKQPKSATGITREELHDLLHKASKPIKKSSS